MEIVSRRVGRATNGPSTTTIVQLASSSELVALRVVVEADSYAPQCRVTVQALDTATNAWSPSLVSHTAERTLALMSGVQSGQVHLSNAPGAYKQAQSSAMQDDEAEALALAVKILNAARKEDLE